MSQQLSKKKLCNLIITGTFHKLNITELKHFILSLRRKCNFFSQYDTFIQHKLKTFPSIKSVTVKKEWPDKLLIHIVDIHPIAYWNNTYILDKQGTLINILQKLTINNIPYFYGPKNSEKEILQNYNTIKNILKNNNILLKSILLTPQHSLKFLTQENIEIIIGRISNSAQLEKLTHIWNILKYQEKVKRKKIQYIDLRYKSGIAIKWK
ncbi:MAG: cell division protein FtsQ/DivIB [Buchnera aphidicola (Melaphis rhois)]